LVNIEKCGKQEQENFDQELLDEMISKKHKYYTFFQKNKERFLFDKDLAHDEIISSFREKLGILNQHEGEFFEKPHDVESEEYKNSIFPILDILTSLGSYEIENSIQKEKGHCEKARDQWVFQKKDCKHNYPFVENNIVNIENFTSGDDLKTRQCFAVTDWSEEQVTERYKTAFKHCRNITSGTDTNGDEITTKYGEFTIELINDTRDFLTRITETIESSYNFFEDMNNSYQLINKTTY
jgi:hypothetical protein